MKNERALSTKNAVAGLRRRPVSFVGVGELFLHFAWVSSFFSCAGPRSVFVCHYFIRPFFAMNRLVFLSLFVVAVRADLPSNNPLLSTAVQEFECRTPYVDCANHGVCVSNGTFNFACKCDSGYTTANCAQNVQCCYKQKSRVLLFLISFFFAATGAPYFMLGATGLGVGILLLWCCGCCCLGAGGRAAADGENKPASIIACIGCLAFLAANAWCLALWIMFASETEDVKDKNGVPVAPW